MADEILKRDDNHQPVIGLVTDDANLNIKMGRIDNATKGLKVMIVGGIIPGTGTVTSIAQGTGMNFSVNPLVVTGTINLADTAVTPGAYTNANITVDQQGRITLASSGTIYALVNQQMHIGTTAVAINRASGALALAGVSIDGSSGSVTNATFTTALTVNGGTLTLTANAANSSVLTIGAGAVGVSGSNTGDQDFSGYALVGQTMYIGSTAVAINRATGALVLTGITSIDGSSASCSGNAATVTNGVYTNANQTITGQNKFNNIIDVNNAITATGNAATVPITYRLNTVTNNSANTLTITMTTASAVDGQMTIVRIYDFSGAAQTITWVNTENSTVTAPTTSNGSTTLPLTVGFMYNGQTTKWRCIASA